MSEGWNTIGQILDAIVKMIKCCYANIVYDKKSIRNTFLLVSSFSIFLASIITFTFKNLKENHDINSLTSN